MPSDKMVILAEGQRPVFADKLRFFAMMPFRSMETFSKMNIPDVPVAELLPSAAVPATTDGYARRGKSGQRTCTNSIGFDPALRCSGDQRESSATQSRKSPVPGKSARAVEASFVVAARKLKGLLDEKSPQGPAGAVRDWSAVFEETVPDADELDFRFDC